MPLNEDKEAARIRRMMKVLGVCVQTTSGRCYGFLDETTRENDAPGDLPQTMRRTARRALLTVATADADGMIPSASVTVNGVGYKVWSEPLRENDGLTTVVPLVVA